MFECSVTREVVKGKGFDTFLDLVNRRVVVSGEHNHGSISVSMNDTYAEQFARTILKYVEILRDDEEEPKA